MTQRALIYVSSKRADAAGARKADMQEQQCTKWAESQNLEIVEIQRAERSRSSAEELAQELADHPGFDVLVIDDEVAISRAASEVHRVWMAAHAVGAKVISARTGDEIGGRRWELTSALTSIHDDFMASREYEELEALASMGRVRVETDQLTQEEVESLPAVIRTLSGEKLDEIDDCTCIEYCDEDPKTKCGLSGIPHVHPEDPNHPGAYGPCPVHPGRPGDTDRT